MSRHLETKNLIAEFGSDLVSGTATIHEASFATIVGLHSGPESRFQLLCLALPGSGSPRMVVSESVWNLVRATGAAAIHSEYTARRRTWGGFGTSPPLSTSKSVRLSVHLYEDTTPMARSAVSAFVEPEGTVTHDLLLGRDSWMRYNTHTYNTLTNGSPIMGNVDIGIF